MTREEFYEKYGEVFVKFESYYKYTFTFTGTLDDGSIIIVEYGGDSNEIYRFELVNNQECKVVSLYPYAGRILKDGKEVEGFYDF